MWRGLPRFVAIERFKALLLIIALIAFSVLLAGLLYIWKYPTGRLVEGRVEEFGLIARKWGFTPLITVRLADGSRRQVLAARQFNKSCRQGDKIALIQRGDVLNVGIRGCYR
jgi:hypothetical protein